MQRRNFLKCTAAMAAVGVTGNSTVENNMPVNENELNEFRDYPQK